MPWKALIIKGVFLSISKAFLTHPFPWIISSQGLHSRSKEWSGRCLTDFYVSFQTCLKPILSWQESEGLKSEFLVFEDLEMMSTFPSITVESGKKQQWNLLVTMEKLGISTGVYSSCNGINRSWVLVSKIQVSEQICISPPPFTQQ